jgi:hypothetical protein
MQTAMLLIPMIMPVEITVLVGGLSLSLSVSKPTED